MKPNIRLSKDDCDPNPNPDFYRRYRGIVGSLGYLITMTRPDLAWSYSELSKYVYFPGVAHMEASEQALQYLLDTWNESIAYTRGSRNPNDTMNSGAGLTQIWLATLIHAAHTLATLL